MFTHRLVLLSLLAVATAIPAIAAAETPSRRPSLDALTERASSYWNLLAKGQSNQALQYVQPQSKDNYLARQVPVFSHPRITALELSPIPAEVWVTVTVRRVLYPIATPLDWPVKEKWVFEGGSWLVVIPKTSMPLAAAPGLQPPSPPPSSDEMEKTRRSIAGALHFKDSRISFGQVRQGQVVTVELGYSLAGNQAMPWKLKDAPRGLTRSGKELTPGEAQKVEMTFLTQEYDGKVDATFTILVGPARAEVSYNCEINGYVYTPVSVSPRSLRYLKGETSKEITLTNNSKSELEIVSARASKSELDVKPLPQTVASGAVTRLTVTLPHRNFKTNSQDDLTLRFAKPVDEMQSVVLPVIVNYEPIEAWKSFGPPIPTRKPRNAPP